MDRPNIIKLKTMLREAKGNMYSWVTHTWNTVKGECPHGCTYCYMHRWGKQKPVHFDESELKTDLGSGNFIFVGSSCDLFADDIPIEWVNQTINHCREYVNNSYLFQTKNPERLLRTEYLLPENSKLCTTIESNRYYSQMHLAPPTIDRAWAMSELIELCKYVTIEPVMDFDLDEMVRIIELCHPIQVNIGADSGNNNLPEPSKEKLLALIEELKRFTTIDKKTNLNRLLNK